MKVCWNLTNLCNENCYYCFRELKEKARPIEDNLVIVNKLKNMGVESITFAGGEPLLYEGIQTLLEYSHSLGIKCNLITNGKCLTKDNLDDYLSYLSKLTFSIDSPSEYVNTSSGRGVSHYKHIKELLPYIKEKYPNIILEINTVVTRENIKEIDFMFEAIGSEISFYGLKKWKISRFCPLRGYAKERQSIFDLTDKEFLDIERMYGSIKAPFEVSVRNIDALDENFIISPAGALKKSDHNNEYVLVEDIIKSPVMHTKKILSLGGKNV